VWLRGADIYLEVDPLSVVSGTVDPDQMWATEFGVVGDNMPGGTVTAAAAL
jgi:hypothetical protein